MPKRTAKTSGGKTTEYIWSGNNIVREEEPGKSIDYLYGINRVSKTISGDNYRGTYYESGSREEIAVDGYSEYYFCDGRGNVMQMVSSDYSGGISQIAFGKDASEMPELKIAEVYDDIDRDINSNDFQTYVINAPVTRSYYYDPYGGQWNEDNGYDTNPFRYAGEQWDRETGSIYLRARFYSPGTGRFMTVDPIKDGGNWYTYCAGNPVMFRNPSGEELVGQDAIAASSLVEIIGKQYPWTAICRGPLVNARILSSIASVTSNKDTINAVADAYKVRADIMGSIIFKEQVTQSLPDSGVILDVKYHITNNPHSVGLAAITPKLARAAWGSVNPDVGNALPANDVDLVKKLTDPDFNVQTLAAALKYIAKDLCHFEEEDLTKLSDQEWKEILDHYNNGNDYSGKVQEYVPHIKELLD